MKKVFLGIAVVGLAFVLSGCGAKKAPQDGGAQNQTKEESKEQGSVIGSIKDAMGLGKKMKCEYSVGTGKEAVKSTAYVEGKKYKAISTINGTTTNSIFDGNTMYYWQEGQKTGMKMAMSCMEELNKSLPEDQQNPEDFKSPEEQFEDAIDTSCVPATESINFSAPSDVTFQDQCEMMKNLINSFKTDIPAGAQGSMPDLSNLPGMPVGE